MGKRKIDFLKTFFEKVNFWFVFGVLSRTVTVSEMENMISVFESCPQTTTFGHITKKEKSEIS